ncbi:hypothetical protein [Streptomyces sp. NRRL F-4428]|nr:hypothetical protein [Streptomyces sp. NRRL F-4428]
MNQRQWKPAGHRRGVERVAMAVLAVAAVLLAAGAITSTFMIVVYALA